VNVVILRVWVSRREMGFVYLWQWIHDAFVKSVYADPWQRTRESKRHEKFKRPFQGDWRREMGYPRAVIQNFNIRGQVRTELSVSSSIEHRANDGLHMTKIKFGK
jgi:hypothetical protein